MDIEPTASRNRIGRIMTIVIVWTALSIMIALIGAFPGCSGNGGASRVIVTVNGISITEGEFAEEYDYQHSYWDLVQDGEEGGTATSLTEAQLKTRILSEMLIPMAAMKARYGEKIPLLMTEAGEIMKKIDPQGSNFHEVAQAHSKDTNARTGGSLGNLPRYGMPYPISRMAFTHDEGTVVGPFLSLVGCHILFVESKAKSAIPSGDTVRAHHILLPFEPERPDFMARMLPEILGTARVEAVDPAYGKYVSMELKE